MFERWRATRQQNARHPAPSNQNKKAGAYCKSESERKTVTRKGRSEGGMPVDAKEVEVVPGSVVVVFVVVIVVVVVVVFVVVVVVTVVVVVACVV